MSTPVVAGERPSAFRSARKSATRVSVVDQVLATLMHESIYRTLDYRNKSEAYLKQYMHQPLQRAMLDICRRLQPDCSERTLARKAGEALFWEGDTTTTVNHVRFLGVQHRPDFVVKLAGIRIAVEVKRGESGSSVREGIGQSMAYAGCGDFDFVVYLFIDTSRDKKILGSLEHSESALSFIDSLWESYNVRFSVI
jgi:hypothetical protein